MKTVGLFEAKTKLSEICAEVAESKISVIVTRRGLPWVRIEPLAAEKSMSVMERREKYLLGEGKRGVRREKEFMVPPRSKDGARETPFDA